MSGMDRHNELQQHRTAAEYRQAADEHVRTLKDFWKDFLVSGLFVLAAIVAIFACLAWFAANNRVCATGSTIGAKAERYIITTDTTGKNGVYDDGTGTTFNIADSMDVSGTSNFNNKTAGYLALAPAARLRFTFSGWMARPRTSMLTLHAVSLRARPLQTPAPRKLKTC